MLARIRGVEGQQDGVADDHRQDGEREDRDQEAPPLA